MTAERPEAKSLVVKLLAQTEEERDEKQLAPRCLPPAEPANPEGSLWVM